MDKDDFNISVFLWLDKLRQLYDETAKLPSLTKSEASDFYHRATASNLSRMRYIAILLIVEDILLLVIVGFFLLRNSYQEYASFIDYSWLNTMFFVPLAVFILLTVQTVSPNKVKTRHWITDRMIIGVLFAGIIALCLITGDSTSYLIAIMIYSLVFSGKARETLFIYFCFLVSYILGMNLFAWEHDKVVIEAVEAVRVTTISFLVFWIRLRTNMIIYHRDTLIQSQNIELAKANAILKDLSMLDPLTGIPNRRSFDMYFSSEWKRAIRDGSSIGVVLIDIDCFKQYNDRYGHQQGDTCLRQVAKALHGKIHRMGDMVARYGGEEFVAVLPHSNVSGATAFGERLRQAVVNLKLEHKDLPWKKVSISLGVAACQPDQNSVRDDFLKQADQALYKAKQKGRNRVEKQD